MLRVSAGDHLKTQVSDPETNAKADRLDSWKAIARHLSRDVRTVRRWEKSEGLPVHRHLHEKRASVYAFKSELDHWWQDRTPPDTSGKPVKARRSGFWIAASGVAAALIAFIALLYPQPSSVTFQSRDWILIADFENRTGETVFDGSLELALQRSLAGSSYVNVTPAPRIADTLNLMQRPPDTPLTAEIAREIALRDGGIRCIVTGRAETLGATYVITLALIEPRSGAVALTLSEKASDRHAVVRTVEKLATNLRSELGETLPGLGTASTELAKVTTESLPALQYFSQGLERLYLNQQQASRDFLERAVAEDPDFATAHVFLAWVNDNIGYETADASDKAKSAHHFERAFELAGTTSDRERLFILGSYYQAYEPDLEKAAQHYKALLRYYPDDYWANNNLAILLHRHGRVEESVPYATAMADARPNALFPSLVAAQVLAVTGRLADAKPYLDTIHRMGQTIEGLAGDETAWAHFMFYRVYGYWSSDDLDGAARELEWIRQNAAPPDESARNALAQITGLYYLSTGQIALAEREFRRIGTEDRRGSDAGPVTAPLWGHMEDNEDPDYNESMSWLAFARGDLDALSQHLRAGQPLLYAAALLPRAGLQSDAERAIAELDDHPTHPIEYRKTLANTIRGSLYFHRGSYDEAIQTLSDAERHLRLPRSYLTTLYLLTVETLAESYLAIGNTADAVAVLDRAANIRPVTLYWQESSGYPWMRVRALSVKAHRAHGDDATAKTIEAELENMLRFADDELVFSGAAL